MEINLKQSEIEVALRQYVASQGFNLTGRAVAITFTSGRTANGLTALVDIGDVTEVPASTVGQVGYRTLELRPSDLPSGSDGVAQASTKVIGEDPAVGGTEAGAVAPEAGEVGESPVTPAPEASDEPAKSLFAKPASN
jgi:hypothetical protein